MDNSLYTAKTLVRERADIMPEEITALITQGALDITMFIIKDEFELTVKQEQLLENEIILVLLFFLDVKDFTQRVSESLEIDILVAEKITSVVHADIFSEVQDLFDLIDGSKEKTESITKKEDLSNLHKDLTVKKTPAEAESKLSEKKLTELSNVQPMRTMEGDMGHVHGYGAYRNQFPDEANASEHTEETIRKASQEEILKEKPQLAEKPSYGSEA